LIDNPNVSFNWLKWGDSEENRRYYFSMLYYAEVIISIFSTTAIEAAIFDKPILTIGFDGYKARPFHESIVRLEKMSHFKNILETGSVKVVRSFEELFENLKAYLENPSLDKEKRKFLVQKMCYQMDGRASGRIADFVIAKANG
jgi:CDP-glycerol glycerophosphotransferase (TagB/SpsB family)